MSTFDELFGRMRALQSEILHGRDHDGRWSMRRFSFEIRSNDNGHWIVDVRDHKRLQQQGAKPGDEIAIGLDPDPLVALEQALAKLGLLEASQV